MRRRAFLLAVGALAACKDRSGAKVTPTHEPTPPAPAPSATATARADEPMLPFEDLVRDAPARPEVDLAGRLEARSFNIAHGCTYDALERWLVLAVADKRWLLNVVSTADLAVIREDAEARAKDAGAPPSRSFPVHVAAPDDAAKLGVRAGQHVRVRGVAEALEFHGGIASVPIFGVTTDKLEPA